MECVVVSGLKKVLALAADPKVSAAELLPVVRALPYFFACCSRTSSAVPCWGTMVLAMLSCRHGVGDMLLPMVGHVRAAMETHSGTQFLQMAGLLFMGNLALTTPEAKPLLATATTWAQALAKRVPEAAEWFLHCTYAGLVRQHMSGNVSPPSPNMG